MVKKQPRHLKVLPLSDPPETTRRVVLCLPDDDEWMSYFWGALSPLSWWMSWERDPQKRGKDVARYWLDILSVNKRHYIEGSEPECSNAEQPCVTYRPTHPAFQFAPQDPFEQPDYVPPGYLLPPWTWVQTQIPILNAQPGDVISTPLSFPGGADWNDLLTEGFARFRFTFFAPATIELHLLNIPQGGLALVTWDDNPLTLTTIDMNRDLASVPPELISEVVTELTFETPGKHWIDCAFVPIVDDSSIPLRYGGGVRKIVVCRSPEQEMFDMDVRQKPGEPCILQKKRDNETAWTDWANLRLCPPLIRQGENGIIETSPDGGTTWQPAQPPPLPPRPQPEAEAKCLAAMNAADVLVRVYEDFRAQYATTNDVLTLAFLAFGLLGFVVLFPPAAIAIVPVVVSIIALGNVNTSPTTQADRDALTCALLENAVWSGGIVTFNYAAVLLALSAETSTPLRAITLMLPLFGADGLNRAGAISAITDADCSACAPPTFCYYTNFAVENDGRWTKYTTAGVYSGGLGWSGTSGGSSGDWEEIGIEFSLPSPARISSIYAGFIKQGAAGYAEIRIDGTIVWSEANPNNSNPTVSVDVIGQHVRLYARATSGQTARITECTIEGDGAEFDFGSQNC